MHTSDNRKRINELCTEVGMLMEDASVVALTVGALPEADLETGLNWLSRSVVEMQKLLAAACALKSDG